MTRPKARRRQAGEGTISEYQTKAGTRLLIKYTVTLDDGSKRIVLRRRGKDGLPFADRKAAAAELGNINAEIRKGAHVIASKMTVAQHCDEWLDGLRKSPSTVASYRKNVRLHVVPHVGNLRLDQLTGMRLTKLYRKLETEGRADKTGGLSARTVRYIHTIIHSALGAAVRDGRLAVNPADKATPPSVREAASPEMHTWDGDQLRTFLDWSQSIHDELYPAWLLLAMTGMRRGEALACRWGDFDFDAGTVSVRRSVTVVKTKGSGEQIIIGPPKSGKARVIDLDPQTLAAMRSHRAKMASVSLALGRDDAPALGTIQGETRHPERFSRTFQYRMAAARKSLGDDALSPLRLHDLRHTHATLLLQAGVHPKIVSERLGHAKVSITLDVYSHAVPTLQREAATRLAALVYGATS